MPRPIPWWRAAQRAAGFLAVAVVVVGGLASVVVAGSALDPDAPRRRGAIVGGVVGRGSGDFDVSRDGVTASSGWSSGGNIVRGRLGWALTEELVVIGEYGVWRRSSAATDSSGTGSGESSGPVDRYLGAGMISINLYPHLGGFLLKAGLGYGQAWATAVDDAGNSLTAQAKGPMVVLGVGYEHFFSHDMSIVLGVDAGRIESGPELSGNTLQYTLAFQAYFPQGFLREWF
jgi:hypothetical protein